MGYIAVRPRDPKEAKGFRGIVFLFPGADGVIQAYDYLGGSERAEIVIAGGKHGQEFHILVHEPPDGEERH